jgi:hypothetical protein
MRRDGGSGGHGFAPQSLMARIGKSSWRGLVKSARGAVSVFRPVRFLGPLPEPDVPVGPASGSPQAPVGLRGVGPHPVVGQGLGMIVPR